MLTPLEKKLLLDYEYTSEKMHEQQNQRFKHKAYTFQFPCHDNSIQLEHPEDTYVECPTCHKKYLMTFSANRTKLWSS